MQMWLVSVVVVIACVAFASSAFAEPRIARKLDVLPVWSGHPVGFALLTHDQKQYVAFYDADRWMTVGERLLSEDHWRFTRLSDGGMRPGATSARTGWDSHNYIVLAVDAAGHLHLSGNMHGSALLYFRTERPGDATSLQRVDQMVGDAENRTTYPRFITGPAGELIFAYRNGTSGDGADLYNVYDVETRRWSRLVDAPLTDGEGKANAYCAGPTVGPDGYYHMAWVWRDTPDCRTNHDLSYARSRDLRHWEDSFGKPIALPITMQTGEVVDPVPAGGGIINGNTRIGFDSQGRVILTYHKFDEAGNTQLYAARRETSGWRIVQVSDWNYRWDFVGNGSIVFEIGIGPVRIEDGRLTVTWRHSQYGNGGWVLDEKTLRPIGDYQPKKGPAELSTLESEFPGMQVRSAGDRGQSAKPGVSYRLKWETLPQNRDRPRAGPLPAPSMLRLYEVLDQP